MNKLGKINTMWMLPVVCAGLAFGFADARAVQIEGNIQFGGHFTHNGSDLSDATEITTFINPWTGNEGEAYVSAADGDFGALSFLDPVAMGEPLQFEPSLSVNNPLWAVGGFEFDLGSVSVKLQDSTQLNLGGTGWIKGNGFDDTPGSWNFSGDENGALLSFSSGSSATAVPANAETVMLLGIGLIGLAAANRKVFAT
jgi:hypothetical protein